MYEDVNKIYTLEKSYRIFFTHSLYIGSLMDHFADVTLFHFVFLFVLYFHANEKLSLSAPFTKFDMIN